MSKAGVLFAFPSRLIGFCASMALLPLPLSFLLTEVQNLFQKLFKREGSDLISDSWHLVKG